MYSTYMIYVHTYLVLTFANELQSEYIYMHAAQVLDCNYMIITLSHIDMVNLYIFVACIHARS